MSSEGFIFGSNAGGGPGAGAPNTPAPSFLRGPGQASQGVINLDYDFSTVQSSVNPLQNIHGLGQYNTHQLPLTPTQAASLSTNRGTPCPTSRAPPAPTGIHQEDPFVQQPPPAQVEQPFAQDSRSSDSEFGVPAQFVDAIANAFNFGEAENDLRARLHVYAQLGQQLLRADAATGVFNLAAILELTKERRIVNDQQRLLQAMLVDLSIRLDDTFALSNEQKVNVRLMAGEMLFEPTRINFMHMHLNVIDKLKEDAKTLRFNNIFGNLARERYLMMAVKRICSSQRNSFREMIRDSVTGDNTKTLEDFVYDACVRFSRGDYNQVGHTATARFAILRRFAYEHLDLLDRGEAEDGSDDVASADRASPSPDRSPATHAVSLEEGEAVRKRKRKTAGALRPKKGVDFWSEVEKWFVAHRTEWGAKWSTVPWKNYIRETVDKDHEKYKVQEVFNPYMMQDISGDAGQMSAMETDGGIATASSSGSAGLMSTLLGAFGAL